MDEVYPDHLSPSQVSILKILYNYGPLSGSQFADILEISRAAASKSIDRLYELKLVNRRVNPSDRRASIISLSVQGSELIDRYYRTRNNYMKNILTSFTDEELDMLKQLLDKYIQNSVMKSKDVELVCMVCNGTYGSDCGLNVSHNGQCEYLMKQNVR